MSNNLTLADAINEALDTGKEATFIYNGTTYTFSPAGLISFLAAESTAVDATTIDFSTVPTNDPLVAGQLWSNAGVLTISTGA